MSESTTVDRRRELALEAFHELDSILETLPKIEADHIRAIRGLAIRAQALLWVVYGGAGLDPQWGSLGEDERTLYGGM